MSYASLEMQIADLYNKKFDLETDIGRIESSIRKLKDEYVATLTNDFSAKTVFKNHITFEARDRNYYINGVKVPCSAFLEICKYFVSENNFEILDKVDRN